MHMYFIPQLSLTERSFLKHMQTNQSEQDYLVHLLSTNIAHITQTIVSNLWFVNSWNCIPRYFCVMPQNVFHSSIPLNPEKCSEAAQAANLSPYYRHALHLYPCLSWFLWLHFTSIALFGIDPFVYFIFACLEVVLLMTPPGFFQQSQRLFSCGLLIRS